MMNMITEGSGEICFTHYQQDKNSKWRHGYLSGNHIFSRWYIN